MEKPPSSIRRQVDLAGIGFGVSNELGNCLRWNRWIDHHEKGDANNANNWRDVAEKRYSMSETVACPKAAIKSSVLSSGDVSSGSSSGRMRREASSSTSFLYTSSSTSST